MRKRIITPSAPAADRPAQDGWLDLEAIAEVEVTSEAAEHPVEQALLPGHTGSWRAAEPGAQILRLRFPESQRLRRIRLEFVETETARNQEYILRWSGDGGQSFHEIVRQQWNFSPDGATRETEDHQVELSGVTVLELRVDPDRGNDRAVASLERLQLA